MTTLATARPTLYLSFALTISVFACGEARHDDGAGGTSTLGSGGANSTAGGTVDARGGNPPTGSGGANFERGGAPSGGTGGTAPCDGFCLLGSIPMKGLWFNLSVDGEGDVLFSSGYRLQASRPEAMKWDALPATGPIVFNPHTRRYAIGDTDVSPNVLRVYNPDHTVYDTQPLPSQFWGASVDPLTGRYFVTLRYENQLLVYSEEARSIIAVRSLDEPGSSIAPFTPVFDPSSGNIFVSRYFRGGQAAEPYLALVFDGTYARIGTLEGNVLAADGEQNVYVSNDHYNLGGASGFSTDGTARLEIRDSTTLDLSPTQIEAEAYWLALDSNLNRLYIQDRETVAAYDRASGERIAELPLEGRLLSSIAFATGDDRVYVVADRLWTPEQEFLQELLVFGVR